VKAQAPYADQTGRFWAYVRLLSQEIGYSERGSGTLRRYAVSDIVEALAARGLSLDDVLDSGDTTEFADQVVSYLNMRADLLERVARPNLMNREQAREVFEDLERRLAPTCALPLNKQKGEKRHYAYLTCIVNMLTEAALGSCEFDMDPRGLTTITRDNKPVRTLSRRLDGCYPRASDPVAVWEVKEYYGTTTFGSRVADGVYETILDGLELAELRHAEGVHVAHYLIVDDYFTWWDCGRSYLCRIVDMLHMGLVDEVIVGREVLSRWPQIVEGWPPTK